MLRSVFRGKPIGSLRPRSSADYGLRERWRASRVLDGGLSRRRVWRFAPRAFSTEVEMCWAFVALLRLAPLVSGRGSFWDRGRFLYRLNVNVLLMGWWVVGCYRWTAYPSNGLSSVLDERKRALVVV